MEIVTSTHGAYLQRDLIEQLGRYPVRAALRSGRLERLWQRVLVESARALDPHTRAAGALLLLGQPAVLTGPTAAWLHGCSAIESADTHVLVPYGHAARSVAGLQVHNGVLPQPEEVCEVDGLRVLAADRVVCDLLCTARERDALAVTDQMLAATPPEQRAAFRARIGELLRTRRDPRGTARGARLLELATGRAESPPESWLLLAVVELGFPPPEANWPVYSPTGEELYRLDLAYPLQRIALEYQGYAVHHGRQDEDERRIADIRRRGWIVIEVTVDDLVDTGRLDRKLRDAFERRGYRLPVC